MSSLVSVDKVRVVRVKTSFAIDVLIGGGLGAGVGALVDSRGAKSSPRFTASLAGVGAILGVIIGAIRGIYPGPVVYESPKHSLRTGQAPEQTGELFRSGGLASGSNTR